MKTLRFLILGFLATAALNCHAQGILVTNGGWFPIGYYDVLTTNDPTAGDGAVTFSANIQPQAPPTPPIIAEVITPQIQALADGLQDDPVQIFNYVHDHIRYIVYYGSKKGANLTLLEKSGNDFDQCALLVALLRAAGYNNAGYQFGWTIYPFDNPDGSHRDLHHWLCLNFTNTDWSSTFAYLQTLYSTWRGYPGNAITLGNLGNNSFALQHLWVTVTVGGTNYLLDPSFKVTESIPGVSLPAATGGGSSTISNSLMTAAAGVDFGSPSGNCYTTNLNETAIRATLAGYTTNLLNYIGSNCPNASVEQILGGQYIVPATNTALPQNLPFTTTNLNGTMPVISWVNEPTNIMSILQISFGGKSYQWFIPQLQGQRLSLVYGSSTVQLWQDDTNLASGTFATSDNVTLTAHHPFFGSWDTVNNAYVSSGGYTASHTATYAANSDYAILYSFEPDWGWLRDRQNQLAAYRQQGLSNTSRQVTTETLNVMGLNWELQTEYMSRMLAQQIGVLPMNFQKIGRMAQESGRGYYVDVYMISEASLNNVGQACDYTCDKNHSRWFDLFGYFGSAMEHGMIEQLQDSGLVAASTTKMIQYANANHQAIYFACSTNWSTVQTKLSGYTIGDLTSLINQGYQLLLPKSGSFAIGGSGSWTGYGFMARLANNGGTLMLIGPGTFGGFVSDLSATVDPAFINYDSYSQPLFFNSAPASVRNLTAADPVNMADGTFQAEATDLSLGQAEPRGLSFSRYYNSSRRTSNLTGIAPGWVHNYYFNAAAISSPQACLGGTTPAQAASMLTATAAANSLYSSAPDPKNWVVTDLIAKWGIDQLTATAVSVSLGKDTIQFIKQPDGSYTPPANCTMTLSQTNSAYALQARHGRTYRFNSSGWGTNISDPYGASLNFAYNSSNWVTTATDWKGRTLTFNYSTTSPKRLISVADNAGRSVLFGYSGGNDLATVTDPESKTNKFLYDSNHQITATIDALGQLVTSNVYNSFGQVITQYTQGDANKTWKIFSSGWKTVSQDPAGGQQVYFYDDKTRTVGQRDALGNLTQSIYDGQDHVIATISPLDETNQFIYDGNNNLVQTIDPLGASNTFVYDGQNDLIQALDPLQNPTTYGYNAKFQLIGQTNGAGDWVNYGYDTGDGVLTSRTDPLGTTTYGYDTSYRRLNSITYPNGLGIESFANSSLGDVTNHTDARGFSTTYQYNRRRQLTNSIAPTNLLVAIAFDAVGNQASVTDGRKITYTNTWTATRKLSSVAYPPLAQGVAVVTNLYDSRDWLVKTLDPYQQPTLYTNDAANRLISTTDPLRRTATLGYDADGHQLFGANAGGETNTQTWDARGKPVQLTDGAQHSSGLAYDAAGNQLALTNRNGKKWRFQFDGANRVQTVTTPLNRQTTLTYNHLGLPETITDPAMQATHFYYDAKKRLTNRVDNLASTLYGYDANDNGVTVVENNATNSWTYDAYNHVSSYTDINGYLIQYRYDANGNLTNLVYPGGKTVVYFYDSLNRLTNVTDWAQRKTVIAYDLDSRVIGLTRPNGSYRTNNFDIAGEATNVLDQMSNGLPIVWFKYGWTNTGNMASEFAAPQPHAGTFPSRLMTYDDDNRLATFQGPTMSSAQNVGVDADGNLTNAPLTNDTFAVYAYDARNRLARAGGVTNVYDALNNRVGQFYGTNAAVFVVNPNGQLPQALMRIKNGATNYYVYGPGLLYQVTEAPTGTNVLYYHFDYRGSTVALSDGTGRVTDRMEYSAYGLTGYRAGTNDTPFLFNGRFGVMTDPNGLLYMRARYYNPYLCRFASADPSGFGGGLNQYAYANGNPVSYLDPFGLGALESSVDLSWFNAPTPAQQQVQDVLASFVNFVTLGVANIISAATTGQDLTGNNLDVADAYQQTLESGAFVASFALSLPTDGGSLEAETVLEGENAAAEGGTATAYRAINPAFADTTEASGQFYRSGAAGRLGNDGIYANTTPEGAIAEFQYHNPGVDPAVFKVQYPVSPTLNISPPSGYFSSPLPFTGDANILAAPSLRAPGTLNLLIRNGAVPAGRLP